MTSNKELAFRSSQAKTLVCVWFSMEKNPQICTFRERKEAINSSSKCMGVQRYLWVRMDINIHVQI